MELVNGNKLPFALQEEVKRKFPYRLTTENGYPEKNPCGARVKPISDAEWLARTDFYVTNKGALSNRHNHCHTSYYEGL